MDNWVDPIKDQVVWNYGYINWQGFTDQLKQGDGTAWLEFDKITNEVAREYSKDVESNWQCPYCW